MFALAFVPMRQKAVSREKCHIWGGVAVFLPLLGGRYSLETFRAGARGPRQCHQQEPLLEISSGNRLAVCHCPCGDTGYLRVL